MADYLKAYIYTSEFDPMPGEDMALEEFLTEVMGYIFDPKNMGNRVDLRDLSKWNKDPNNPDLSECKTKAPVLLWILRIVSDEQKVNEYMGDPSTLDQMK